MNDKQLEVMRRQFNGATRDMKARLAQQVDEQTMKEIKRAAHEILASLPKSYPLGTLTAAIMLASTAYAEGAASAERLLETE